MTVNQTAETTEEVDTSTNDDIQDAEKDLEEDDTTFGGDEDTSEEDDTESEDTEEETAATDSDEEETEDSEVETEEEQPVSKDPEAQRREAAAKAFKEREAARQYRADALRNAQAEYVAEATEPHDVAVRQLQVDAYNNRVQTNTNTLQSHLEMAAGSIDLFHKGSKEVKDALYEAVDEFEAMNVVKDRYGNPVEVRGNLLEHLQRKAESIRRLTGVGARQQIADTNKTRARTTTLPSRTPQKPKSDPMLDGFDEEAERP